LELPRPRSMITIKDHEEQAPFIQPLPFSGLPVFVTSEIITFTCDFTLSLKSGLNTMVKLTEVEDEHFADKPSTTKDDALLASDDDDDYTDTGTTIPCSLKLAMPLRGTKTIGMETALPI
jgi:hypothetical protein